jgi:hypothetical protein
MKDRSQERYFLGDLCLSCKHTWEEHFVNHKNKQIWCGFDHGEFQERWGGWSCPCKNFVLDNLKHIEILAEERGLV